jgi:hypothetical protein
MNDSTWNDWDDLWGDSAEPTPPPTPKYPIREGYLYDYVEGKFQRIRPLGWNEMYDCFDLLPGEDDWHLEQIALGTEQTCLVPTDMFGQPGYSSTARQVILGARQTRGPITITPFEDLSK